MKLRSDELPPLVNAVVARILVAVRPEKIILFGSQARGDATDDSDIDLLLIYDGPLSKRDVKLAVRRLFPQPTFSMDLFILTSREFERQKGVVSTLGQVAANEGVVCHG